MTAQINPSDSTAPGVPDLRLLIAAALPGLPQTSRALAESARLLTVEKDGLIFQQGEPITLTLMIEGHGGFRRTTVGGQELLVGVANPGEVYGITSIASIISSVDLVALTDCHVAQWRGSEFRRLAAEDPEFALEIIDRMSAFLQILTDKLDGFLHQGARRRVMRVLARHRDLFFGEPPVLLRSHLPSLVGTSREMTSRVLRQLERDGTIAREGRAGLKLLRPDLLDLEEA